MGEHERGDTITEMGDALTEWLRRWIDGVREREGENSRTDFKIRSATLRTQTGDPIADEESGQPSARVSVVMTDADGVEQEWLLAESWWAGAFRQATFGELAVWAASIGPWLLASQADAILRRVWSAPSRRLSERAIKWLLKAVAYVGLIGLQSVLATLLAPFAFLLLLLSMVPVPLVSDFARGIARNLAGSFGDLLVLVRSPIRFAAMTERVRADIARLDAQCEHVMVVAHSQGSAVAWQAIKRASQQPTCDRPDVALFVSFGQAMRKLRSLYRIHEVGGAMQTWFTLLAVAGSLLLVTVFVAALSALGDVLARQGDLGAAIEGGGWYWLVLGVGIPIGIVIQLVLQAMARANDSASELQLLDEIVRVRASFRRFRWVDLWASADPAPNGPLLANPMPPVTDYVESYRLRNMGSTLLDHSVYWSNVTEFVSTVALLASGLAWPNPIGVRALSGLREPIGVRDARVNQLAVARVVFFVGIGFVIAGAVTSLVGWGTELRRLAAQLPFVPTDWFACCPPAVDGALAAALIAVVGLVIWLVVVRLWRLPVRSDETGFFKARPVSAWDWRAAAWLALALAPPILAVTWVADRFLTWWPAWLYLLAFVVVATLASAAVVTVLTAGGKRVYEAPPAP